MKRFAKHFGLAMMVGVVTFAWFGTVLAQWPSDPSVNVPICTATEYQYYPQIASDGSGGAIITWYDRRSGNYDIYAQRVSALGFPQWTPNGVAICTATNYQYYPEIVSDGSGGAIITWYDSRSGSYDIYAQRVNAAGAVQWTANGVAICTAGNSQYRPTIVSDGSGGAIITWYDYRNSASRYDIYAQRVNAAGVPQWTANGVAICTAAYYQYYPQIVSDGSGGAIITWYDSRNSATSYDIYAQRVNASGAVQWTPNGVAICTATNAQYRPELVSDGSGGAVITWYDYRNSANRYDIYAQRVNASGTVQWTPNGVAICTASQYQYYPQIASDGSGGAIITWYDSRAGSYDIYTQRVNASGAVQWTPNGVAICTATDYQYYPEITTDGSGGAIITWYDYRGTRSDIYAQRVNASGAVQWTADGVEICTAAEYQYRPTIVADGSGGAIITWYDYRNSANRYDIYAQNVNSDGSLGIILPPSPLDILQIMLTGSFTPPNPWTQQEFVELSFEVTARDTSLYNVRFFSDPLQHQDLPKKIPDYLVEFIPEEIGFLEDGAVVPVLVKVEIPIGQHEGDYTGYFRAVCSEGLSDSVEVTLTVNSLADIDFDRERVTLAARPGGSASGLCVVVNPNSWDNNPDGVDGPGNVDLQPIGYQFTDLTGPGGTIPSSQASVSGNQPSLGSGASDEVTLAVDVPSDQLAGTYTGTVYVQGTPFWTYKKTPTRKADLPVSDSLTLEVTVLAEPVLDIVENSVSDQVTPPDPWPEPLSGEFFFQVKNTGNETLENIELASTDLEYANHAPLYGRTVEFDPVVIASLAPDEYVVVTAAVPVPIGAHAGLYVGTFSATAAAMDGAADELVVNLTVNGLADLDIHDYAGNLSANTMRLIGPSGAIVAGLFNAVSPNMWENNFDPFDGPGNVDLSNINYLATDLVCRQGHTIPSGQVSVPGPCALGSGEAHQHIISVDLTDISPAEKDYNGYVFARVGADSEDVFTLVVNVDASGQLCGDGFRGEPRNEGNLLEWQFSFNQQGFNLYRSEPGMVSFVRLNPSLINATSYVDEEVLTGLHYEYQLGLVFRDGRELLLGPLSLTAVKEARSALFQNSPNPMSNKTVIRYVIPFTVRVSLRVHDVAGRVVTTLVDEQQRPGYYSVSWDGKNSFGREVPGGVYFCRLTARHTDGRRPDPSGEQAGDPALSGTEGSAIIRKMVVVR